MKCPVCFEQDNFLYYGKGKLLKTGENSNETKEIEIYRCNFCYSKVPDYRILKNWEYGDLEKRLEEQ